MTPLILAILAAPSLTGPPAAVKAATAVLEKASVEGKGRVAVKPAGRVAGAGYHAAQVELTLEGESVRTYGFGDDPAAAERDGARRAAARLAGRLARPAPAKPPTLQAAGGTLVVLRGLSTFSALDAALEFLKKRDSTARLAMLLHGVPTVRLSKTTSGAGLAAAARGLAPAGQPLVEAKLTDATVTLTFGPAPTPIDGESAPAPGPSVDDEDAPR